MSTFDYELFGLTIRSDLELPELFGAQRGGKPDVRIILGSIEAAPSEPGLRADGEALLLTVKDIGRYRINGGDEIVVDPHPDVPKRNVRLFLLGSAFGALLHQRGLLPLHANAVEIDGKAIAFMGESGAGKSTLAAWFHDQGFRVIADDVCVVQFDAEGWVRACPGLPRLRLWREVMEATGRDAGEFPRSYLGDDDFLKYDVSISSTAAREPVDLGAIFILGRGDSFSVEPMAGLEAANAVFDNTYRGAYLDEIEGHHGHWSAATELVRKVPIYRLSRVWGLHDQHRQGELILQATRASATA